MWRSLWSRLRRRPPNVVWICADDFAPYVSGTYGNPLARTPNLDRLAAQGMRFDRAYCTCPLSTPSRMSFLTGRYPRSVGVTLTPTPLPEDEVTIGGLLRRAGYETMALGKTHYYEPLTREFDRCVDLFEHEAWMAAVPPEPIPPHIEVLGPWRPFYDRAAIWLNSACLPYVPDAAMPDTFFTELAGRHLRRERSKPFFLWVGFYVTHSPFRFPIEFRGHFDPSSFALPEVAPEDVDLIPPVFRDLTDDEKRGILAAYYTSVEYMDRNVGLILDALDRSGHADDTLVAFNSDHGYLLGQHGRFEKHCCCEEAVRSALILRMPGVITPGRATTAMVELIDLVPTILELCRVDVPANVQGKSLVPLLRGEVLRDRDHVIAEYADNAEAMVRTERWKLVYSAGNRRRRDGYALGAVAPGRSIRLYDLEGDARELKDVAGRTENDAVVGDLLARLADHMRRTARDAGSVPQTDDVHALLASCLPPGPPW
jgi:arylsulfatase A-like enzyme